MELTDKMGSRERLGRFCRQNAVSLALIFAAAIGITVTGIIFEQEPLRIAPLYVSLTVGMLQSGANRYANLIGSINSILYFIVYMSFGLYAMAFNALLISCPMQLITFIRWNKNKYRGSTKFRSLKGWQWAVVIAASVTAYAILMLILDATDAAYPYIDNAMTVLGTLNPVLALLSFMEYSFIAPLIGVCSIFLDITMMRDHPAQITYLIYSLYSMICIIRQFFSVRALWREQQGIAARTDESNNAEI